MLATKTQPVEKIRVAIEHGFALIGENRVQELTGKADGTSFTELVATAIVALPRPRRADDPTRARVPATGVQWNLQKRDSPLALIRRKVCTPKPCMAR